MIKNENYQGPLAFFRKHLNGDYSLGRSYWLNTFLVLLFAPALGLILAPLLQDLPARYSSAAVLALTVLGLLAWVWAISGTWASANKHVQRGGKGGWASAAKLMIVLGIIRTVGDVGIMSEGLGEHWRVALGGQLGPQYTIQVSADGKSVVFKGGINDGAAEALTKALDIAPAVNNVVFSSMGGWVREGNLVANIISQRKLSTYVEGECTSACTIAFLAGRDRVVGPDALIGFHQFKSVGETGGDAGDQAMASAVYERAGVSREFINRIVTTPSDQVWYPDHNELLAANVITRESTNGEITSRATRLRTQDAAGCELSPLTAIDRIQIRKLVVRTAPEDRNSLIVDAVILNEAEFEQPFPAIGLTFSNLNGDVVAQSLFTPAEYLAGEALNLSAMPPETPIRIVITIRDPGRDAVTYNIKFQPCPHCL